MLYFHQPNAFRKIPLSRGVAKSLNFCRKVYFSILSDGILQNPATLKIAIYIIQMCTCRSSEKVSKPRKLCSDMRHVLFAGPQDPRTPDPRTPDPGPQDPGPQDPRSKCKQFSSCNFLYQSVGRWVKREENRKTLRDNLSTEIVDILKEGSDSPLTMLVSMKW